MTPVQAVAAARAALSASASDEVCVPRTVLMMLASCVALRGAQQDEVVAQVREEMQKSPKSDETIQSALTEILDRIEGLSEQIEAFDKTITSSRRAPAPLPAPAAPKPVGRPPGAKVKKPPDFRERAAKLLAKGPISTDALHTIMGLTVHRMTLMEWLRSDPWFEGIKSKGFGLTEVGRQGLALNGVERNGTH